MSKHVLLRGTQLSLRALHAASASIALMLACAVLAGCAGAPPATPVAARAPAPRTAAPPTPLASRSTTAPVPRIHVPPLRCTVDVYGDSIMANNSTDERPLAAVQKRHPKLTIIDHSAPEVLLTELGRKFNDDARTGHWVVIENGVIDAWRNVNPAQFVMTLKSIVERIRAEGREPILTGFSHQTIAPALHIHKGQLIRRDQYNELTKRLAANMNVAFVDWDSVRFNGPDDLQDGVHPNLDYSNRLFDKLLATLVRVTDCR